ncbi:MAG: hypothetical protein A2270_09270 [Elusimicrobia bacterium RIFOXYA12_FULL_51_18]|nr:MAG: hypothetical protein A2270_09270 [Elusimicrobia bacterium RIFOXYA12_FULL_51_18]OGS32270.1 MAG: hypothetical protein A2218_04155 [Elusimicrobia bacterium RIFOXYA2_FULL_53_38]
MRILFVFIMLLGLTSNIWANDLVYKVRFNKGEGAVKPKSELILLNKSAGLIITPMSAFRYAGRRDDSKLLNDKKPSNGQHDYRYIYTCIENTKLCSEIHLLSGIDVGFTAFRNDGATSFSGGIDYDKKSNKKSLNHAIWITGPINNKVKTEYKKYPIKLQRGNNRKGEDLIIHVNDYGPMSEELEAVLSVFLHASASGFVPPLLLQR